MAGNAPLTVERWLRHTPALVSDHVKRVLVLEYRLPLGCCVHMTPAFEAMKRSRPELEVAVATRSIGSQVLRHSPYIDHLIDTPDPLTDLPSAARFLGAELRRRDIRPECVLTGASDPRTRISLLGLLASNGWRGGFTLKPALYHRPLVYDLSVSLIANNLRVAQLVGCDLTVNRPRVFFSANDLETATSLLREANPAGRPLVVMVTQNSGGQSTGWHTDRWVHVIRAAQDRGCAIIYVGTATDSLAIAAISHAAGGFGHSIAGRTTISQLAAVLASADVVVSLDTGTMHVGRAAGVPMVVLGPSWQKPLEWLPLGVPNVRILRGEDRDDVPPGYKLDEVSADGVLASLDELLAAYPPAAEARAGRVAEGLSDLDHLSAG